MAAHTNTFASDRSKPAASNSDSDGEALFEDDDLFQEASSDVVGTGQDASTSDDDDSQDDYFDASELAVNIV